MLIPDRHVSERASYAYVGMAMLRYISQLYQGWDMRAPVKTYSVYSFRRSPSDSQTITPSCTLLHTRNEGGAVQPLFFTGANSADTALFLEFLSVDNECVLGATRAHVHPAI